MIKSHITYNVLNPLHRISCQWFQCLLFKLLTFSSPLCHFFATYQKWHRGEDKFKSWYMNHTTTNFLIVHKGPQSFSVAQKELFLGVTLTYHLPQS